MGQSNSTLILHPVGQSAITFDTLLPDTTGYYVNTATLVFNEGDREEISYSGGPNVDGGQYVSSHGPLVPVTFVVHVWATDRATAMTRGQTLKKAVTNDEGGTLEFKPEDITVRSTFYHYIKSGIPVLLDRDANFWDGRAKDDATQGEIYTLSFEVDLMTYPVDTSDPDSLVALSLSRSTLDNTYEAATYFNYGDVTGSTVKGDLPAYVRFLLRNSQSGTNQEIAKLYLATRSTLHSTLANFLHIYEAESATALVPTAVWSSPSDGARSGNAYRRCNPDSEYNDVQLGLRFTISNETHHRGRCTVLGAVRAKTGLWTSQIKYTIGANVIDVSSDDNQAEHFMKWSIMVLGEIDMPPIEVSGLETLAPSLEVYFTRRAGSADDYIDLDFIMLAFNNETLALFHHLTDGIDNDQELLFEMTAENAGIAHIVNQSTHAFEDKVDKRFGSNVLVVPPGQDTRLMTLFQRVDPAVVDDDFSTYHGVYVLALAKMVEAESWTIGTLEDKITEGDYSLDLTRTGAGGSQARGTLLEIFNLDDSSILGTGDFVCFNVEIDTTVPLTNFSVYLHNIPSHSESYAYVSTLLGDFSLTSGYNTIAVLKSDFTVHASMNWAKVKYVSRGSRPR
jgi:hypothetical protein